MGEGMVSLSNRKMAFFICSCFIFLCSSLSFFFRIMAGHVFRIKMKDGFYKDDFEVPESVDRKQIEALMDEGTGDRIPALVFKFQHQISEDTYRTEEEEEVEDQGPSLTAVNEDKPSDVDNYGFLPQKDFGRFMESFTEGTEAMIIRVGEPLIGFVEDEGKMGMRFLTSEELLRDQMGEGAGQIESIDFDPDTETSSDGYSVKEINYDSDFEGFLSEKDCGKERSGSANEEPSMKSVSKLDQEQRESFFLDRSEEKEDLTAQNSFRRSHSEEASSENECRGEREAVVLASEGLEKTAENGFKSSIDVSEETEQKEDKEAEKREQEAKKLQTEDTRGFDYEELDELWEHQDLIEQLKIELKKARAFGLPTISKQTQNSRAIEDLKPFKIDEKLLPEHPNDEHQKFYKSYRDSMRKFDILNYQKMYTMRFLQLKDPVQLIGEQRRLIPTIMSHFCKRKSHYDPQEMFIKELQCDLETVYVGQTCLSWEFLRWQYEKHLQQLESDSKRSNSYNHVAGEFQQFLVLIQRFIENESFQGPRLLNYVKQRCILRNLLQVPVIRVARRHNYDIEDCLKDENVERKENYRVTGEMLLDIIEESIRIFWEFIKADKHEMPVILKSIIENHVGLQDTSDYGLFVEIQTDLQKKERKLKDLLKSGNCLIKKLKKAQKSRTNLDLFLSQVDLKLVSRVIKMSKITSEQLMWCHSILSKITFSGREVHRETAFLLFPC